MIHQSHELPPDDIIKLIAIWIHLMDSWDPKLTHHDIVISNENLRNLNLDNVECIEKNTKEDFKWYHCYGNDIIQKGMRKRWKFQFIKTIFVDLCQ